MSLIEIFEVNVFVGDFQTEFVTLQSLLCMFVLMHLVDLLLSVTEHLHPSIIEFIPLVDNASISSDEF